MAGSLTDDLLLFIIILCPMITLPLGSRTDFGQVHGLDPWSRPQNCQGKHIDGHARTTILWIVSVRIEILEPFQRFRGGFPSFGAHEHD